MSTHKDKLAITAAKLYYQSGYSQNDIAKELAVSRPSVSRLLQYAKDQGFVRIEIFDPIEDQSHLADSLMAAYHLKDVCIANTPIDDEEEMKRYIGRRGAQYLDTIIEDGDIIGVGWGTTMHCLSHALLPRPLRGGQIVQLEGGITLSTGETYANEILERFAKNYETIAQYLPLPVLFDSKVVKEMVYKDRHVKRVLELGRNANIAVFSVGPYGIMHSSSVLAMQIKKKRPSSRSMLLAIFVRASLIRMAIFRAKNSMIERSVLTSIACAIKSIVSSCRAAKER